MSRSTLDRGWILLALVGACGDSGRADSDGVPATTGTSLTSISGTGTGSTGEPTPTTSGATTSELPTTGATGGVGGEGDPCAASDACTDGLVCAGGECLPGEGACTGDDECTGDTYCCLAGCLPAGETGGVCIPFGTGPKGDVNDECIGDVSIGLFEPSVQCEWAAPPAGDPYPDHKNVLTTPLIFNLPNDSGVAAEMIIVTYNYTDGGAPAGWGEDPQLLRRHPRAQRHRLLAARDDRRPAKSHHRLELAGDR